MYEDTREAAFPLIMVVGKEGNASGSVSPEVGFYCFQCSGRSTNWNQIWRYGSRFLDSGPEAAATFKAEASRRRSSPVILANIRPLVIPHSRSGKEQLRGSVSVDDLEQHARQLFGFDDLTRRVDLVVLAGNRRESSWNAAAPVVERAAKDRDLRVVATEYFWPMNYPDIVRELAPAESDISRVFRRWLNP